ncbi:DNA-3-methyladenine glycosylase 2 family protein [Rhodoferax sp. PAMC 29310]|uniref:DNA-3-methyladenine glycosylase 2 family protein n=1 Tax=Rhodoferax sp. PAMC 29310 TaxID=2822760 RepID=UPI001B32F9E9|nr:AlkA N-terminal domain-containing protein [Rhodoferax sp. PAMC 29310]
MSHPQSSPEDDACYLALKAKDARFDGCFFTGVTSTGIYCRPVCRVRTPKRENCRFFNLAAQAEDAGFRPCLRCRPEIAPRLSGQSRGPDTLAWSTQDASHILAGQAAQLLDSPEGWGDRPPSVQRLAQRLGVSDRHLRRIFEARFGISPLQYLQTRRLLSAKQWLTDTNLPVNQIATLSGYSSVRRFNAAFVEHYKLNPSALRRDSGPAKAHGLRLKLAYRPPYDVAAMLHFFATRQIASLEQVSLEGSAPGLARTLAVQQGLAQHSGWIHAVFDADRCRIDLQVSDSLHEVLPQVLARARALLDVDADPHPINEHLHSHFPDSDGLRVPGTLDGFELAVRAILGQQITVAAARTLSTRLVSRFGAPIVTPFPALTHLFPSAAALAGASGDVLGSLGIVKQRQTAIQALARAVLDQRLQLHAGADPLSTITTLKTLPGVGDWTAQYIAMRALRWPDAFPSGDVALQKALGVQQVPQPAKAALAASLVWQPWRSYAVVRAWATLGKKPDEKPKITIK